MALVNEQLHEIHCKVVYFGAGSSGKTSNIAQIYRHAPVDARGDVLTVPTQSDQSVSFDFLPLDVGSVDDYRVRFHLLTAPGLQAGEHERAAVLNGVDGVVFVVDSQRERFQENLRSYVELSRILDAHHGGFAATPLVVQYNKRDLPDVVPVPILNARLNPADVPSFEAVATNGVGVFSTLQAISQLILERL